MTNAAKVSMSGLALLLAVGCGPMEPVEEESQAAVAACVADDPPLGPDDPGEPGACEPAKPKGNKYWPPLVGERDVDIAGHDFDFHKSGEVDGPGSHNGKHSSSESADGTVTLKVNVGTDRGQQSDLDVTIEIDKDGNAKVSGKYQGEDLGTKTGTVKDLGNGKFSLTITITTVEDGEPVCKSVTIEWNTSDCG